MTVPDLYLGSHRWRWLGIEGPPLMVSRNVIPTRIDVAPVVPWVLDSGGFTELQQHGRWRTTPEEHAAEVRRIMHALPGMRWAAPQDWMCEPVVISGGSVGPIRFAGTGLDVHEHQIRTTDNFLALTSTAPDVPWIPVLQGWDVDDYHRHVAMYASAGVDLTTFDTVGLGSVCRRQHMDEAARIVRSLADRGLRLHGFGFKQAGVAACWPWLRSTDSMAWSYNARADARRGVVCNRRVKSCANCRHYAVAWWHRTVACMRPVQLDLGLDGGAVDVVDGEQ